MTIRELSRAAALALVFAAPLATAARADDEYGTGHETVVRHAANGAIAPMLSAAQQKALESQFATGQNDSFGAPQQNAVIRQSAAGKSSSVPVDVARANGLMGYYATDGSRRLTAPLADGPADLVGMGGHQDEVAREIYRPGSGTDF
jgi:hypothetical protein